MVELITLPVWLDGVPNRLLRARLAAASNLDSRVVASRVVNVRFGANADLSLANGNVRFVAFSGRTMRECVTSA
jgi:hypothetical protein